ncbi:MAG: thermonuclease family protein [Patescibacteria group bacterium]|nr:thermonuclease family protein [Patescibacteria group bacterium]
MPNKKVTKSSLGIKQFIIIFGGISIYLLCIFSVAFFLIALIGSTFEPKHEEVAGASIHPTATNSNDMATTYSVVSITDGDTIKIDYEGKIEKVRLIGIDTPESKHPSKGVECFSKEATEKMKSLVEGKQVRIEFDETQDKRDKYDRLLLYIWQKDTFINKEMILGGYAHEYTYNLSYKYQEELKSAEKEARENNKGLWGDACECEKGKEKSRDCIECYTAKAIYTNWDCSTYSQIVKDSTCTNFCDMNVPEPLPPVTPTYVCNCSKTCTQIQTCKEAYFQLKCGCTIRDGDNDGVPCENLCPGS